MIRIHRSLYIVYTLLLLQYTLIHYKVVTQVIKPSNITEKLHPIPTKPNEDFDIFSFVKTFQMIILVLFLMLIEFRSNLFIKYFRFTENVYVKSLFILSITCLLYDKIRIDHHRALKLVYYCLASVSLTMVIISPCSKRTKGLDSVGHRS